MEAISVLTLSLKLQTRVVLPSFPLRPFSGKHVKGVVMKRSIHRACTVDLESKRSFEKLSASEWGHRFLSVQIDAMEMNGIEREIEAIKAQVKGMLMSSQDVKKRIVLIHLLVSLGVSYHFEDEIEYHLEQDFKKIDSILVGEDDLHTVSTLFWVFRTYGHKMSSDAFKRFKGSNGKFKESLGGDVKGMLMLYEAAHLATKAEDILDEALIFSTTHLKSLATRLPHNVKRLIENALYMPQHYNAEMLFAREFISFYEQEEDHDKVLLRFAKLSFKFLQFHWIQELNIVTKWWKEQDLTSQLPPYFRDKIVECYFFAFGIFFEPRFACDRINFTKSIKMFSILDDTCDRYGSLAEIKGFVDCMERCVSDSVDELPNYLKTVFKFVWDILEEFKRQERSHERSYSSVKGALDELKVFLRANLQYVEWAEESNVPTYEEFIDVGIVEVGTYLTLAFSFLGLDQLDQYFVGEEAYEWLKSKPNFLEAMGTKLRLMNDMTGFEVDTSRGYGVNAVNYYMKQYGVTKDEAFKELEKTIRDLDKSMNEEYLKIAKSVPRYILKPAINFGKVVEVTYRSGDGYTNLVGQFNKDITSVFFDPMSL